MAVEKPTANPRGDVYKNVFRPWIWEILACAASSSLLAAIVVILTLVDGRTQEDWHLGITLNTLVNVLSTLFRACLASTAAEVISQQKWIWFWSAPAPGRPLRHMQSFDAGSRSLLGSLKLLPVVATRYPLAVLPILVLVSSLLIGPFAQQSIRTVYRDELSDLGTSSLPTSNYMNSSGSYFRTRSSADYVWWSLQSAPRGVLINAIENPTINDSVIIPTCPTGNCDFPVLSPYSKVTHTSLGVCSSCTDVTSMIKHIKVNGTQSYTLPNGMRIDLSDDSDWETVSSSSNMSWAEKAMTKEEAAVTRWAFVNTTVLTMSLADQPDLDNATDPNIPVAATCSLYPCIRSYAAKVRDNELSETVVGSTPLVPDVGNYTGPDADEFYLPGPPLHTDGHILAAIQSPCRVDEDVYFASNISQAPGGKPVRLLTPSAAPEYPPTSAPEECITRTDLFTHTLIGAVYKIFLNGTCSYDSRNGGNAWCGDTWWLDKFWESKRASPQTISDRFRDIAESTTKKIRLGYLRPEQATTTKRVSGMTVRRIAYVHIEWSWMILPIALLALDIAVLVYMIVRSIQYQEKEAVWKSNPLPLLYYKSRFIGLEPDGLPRNTSYDPLEMAASDRDQLMTSTELEDVAQNTKVRLRRGQREGGVVNAPVEQVDVEGGHDESRQQPKPTPREQEHEVLLPGADDVGPRSG